MFLNILIDLNNTVVWIVTTWPFISESSNTFTKILRMVPSAPTKIGITDTFMFHSFFVLKQGQGKYIFFTFFIVVSGLLG